ncbi:MAG: hypothetical protein KDD64_03415, partial [Bdellovibrionales bacterium]|nr:hypothetical protein [Bdellovibrionales bacterium]
GEFFSQAGSSAQRLRNGNTLISQDRQDGRVFEVTPSGEIVWDLELKHFPHRAKRYEPNYCPNLGT